MKKGIIILPLFALLAGCGAKDETAVVDPFDEIVAQVEADLDEQINNNGPAIDTEVIPLNETHQIEARFGTYTLAFKNARIWEWTSFHRDDCRNVVFQVDIENQSYQLENMDNIIGILGDIPNIRLVDQDGYVCDRVETSIDVESYHPLQNDVLPGEKFRATLSYYIPEGKQTITVKYDDKYLFEFKI